MNLWAKSLRQLAFFAVALFFFSCEDETIQGYKTNPKLKVAFREFTLPSSVLQLDSIRTSNYVFGGETNALLLGQYTDPIFGKVKANFYTQFYPTQSANIIANVIYDSAFLELAYDFYHYGTSNAPQSVSAYLISENMLPENRVDFINRTSKSTSTFVGSKEFSVNTAQFDKYVADQKDTTILLRIPLVDFFGQSLLAVGQNLPTSSTDYYQQHKGIAVKSDVGDAIFRFNPSNPSSKIQVHYHVDTIAYSISFTLNSMIGFNEIKQDWSGTQLAAVQQPYTDYFTDQIDRFIQSGSGLSTKIDLSEFIAFADATPNILINSAELVIDDVYESDYQPPATLAVRAFDDRANRIWKYSSTDASYLTDLAGYGGYFVADYVGPFSSAVQIESDSTLLVVNDVGTTGLLRFDEDNMQYSGFATMFFQELATKENNLRPRYFVLYPRQPAAAKSVNRVSFPKDKIKLRIYYTTPQD